MKMFLLVLFFGISMALNAQSLNVGFSTLAHLAKFEANYSLNKKIDVGAFYGLGLKSLAPHYFGATGKYQFPTSNTSKGTLGAYVGGSMGLAVSPSYEVFVI
jgi:cell division protein FtsI/penicillin-binding protein 2